MQKDTGVAWLLPQPRVEVLNRLTTDCGENQCQVLHQDEGGNGGRTFWLASRETLM